MQECTTHINGMAARFYVLSQNSQLGAAQVDTNMIEYQIHYGYRRRDNGCNQELEKQEECTYTLRQFDQQ